MPAAFTFQVGAGDLYQHAISKVAHVLESLGGNDMLDRMDDESLTDHLADGWLVEPLEWDSDREASIARGERSTSGHPPRRQTTVDSVVVILTLPLVPKRSNEEALAIEPSGIRMSDRCPRRWRI